jgi:hypothetical protein
VAAQPGCFSFCGEQLAGESLNLYSTLCSELAGLHHFRLLHRKSSGVDVDKLINIVMMMRRPRFLRKYFR